MITMIMSTIRYRGGDTFLAMLLTKASEVELMSGVGGGLGKWRNGVLLV